MAVGAATIDATLDATLGAGAVAIEGGEIASGEEAAQVIQTTKNALQMIGAKTACALFEVAAALEQATTAGSTSVNGSTCGVTVIKVTPVKAKPESLPPCDPPEGTLCWKMEDTHYHAGLKPHYHLYQMQRWYKTDGMCHWTRLSGKVGRHVFASQPKEIPPCNAYPNFTP